MTRRFWIAAALTLRLWSWTWAAISRDLRRSRPRRLDVDAACSGDARGAVGRLAILSCAAWALVVHASLNMFTLIALGVGVAYLYSVAAALAPGLSRRVPRHGGIAVYFEAAAVITVLVLLGQVLELRARSRTGRDQGADGPGAEDGAPGAGRRRRGGRAARPVAVGDRLRVRPGEKVPVDGAVLEGRIRGRRTLVTGESMPVTKEPGDKRHRRHAQRSGGFVMRAEKVGSDTMLAQIVQMVAEAQRSRAPIQRLADKVSAWFVPAVMRRALVTFAAWCLRARTEPRLRAGRCGRRPDHRLPLRARPGDADVDHGRRRPRRAGRRADPNAEALERLEKVDTLVVDKTGTLTEGKPKVVAVVPAPGFDEANCYVLPRASNARANTRLPPRS